MLGHLLHFGNTDIQRASKGQHLAEAQRDPSAQVTACHLLVTDAT